MTFSKKWIPDGILPVKINFLPKTKMVRMVHMTTFGRMDLENMEPKTQKLPKSDLLKNDHVQLSGKSILGPEKAPAGCPTDRK